MKQSQRYRKKPLQRTPLACIEKRSCICIKRSGIAPILIPFEQLNQRLRTLHHIARLVEKRRVALQCRRKPFALHPFEGFELGGGTGRRTGTTGVGDCA